MARPRKFDEETVLDAAMNLFWRQGYEGTGLADLLDAMGMQRGSLYKAWGSKKGLFMAVLDRYHTLHIAPGLQLLEGGTGSSGAERIAAVFASHDNRGCLMCNSAGGIAGTDPDVAAWIEDRMERLIAAFEAALVEDDALDDPRAEAENLTRRYVGMRIDQRVKGRHSA